MRKWFATVLVNAAVIPAMPALAAEEHYDVAPYIEGGKVYADGVFHDYPADPSISLPVAFGYEFGEFPLAANAASDPGFNIPQEWSEIASPDYHPEVTDGTIFGFRAVDGLLFWDGTGPVNFAPTPAGTFLYLFQGASEIFVDGTASGFTDGFEIIVADFVTPGADDQHLNSQVWTGDPLDDATWVAPAGTGIYAIELNVLSTGFTPSDAIFAVYNYGADEEAHELAVEAFAAVPEPASIAFLGLVIPLLTRRPR